ELDKGKNTNKNDHIHMKETELQEKEKKSNNWNNLFSMQQLQQQKNVIEHLESLVTDYMDKNNDLQKQIVALHYEVKQLTAKIFNLETIINITTEHKKNQKNWRSLSEQRNFYQVIKKRLMEINTQD
ncbi:hypothetical protein RFI_34696, partial [Reticulomyxa filosa]